jgi:sulfur carrier protein
MVTLNLNGEDRRFEESLTIAELIRSLQIKASSIAVEVNRVIVPRSSHPTHRLKEGDRVEIVTFVGGG